MKKKRLAAVIGGKGKEGRRWVEILRSDGWKVVVIKKSEKTVSLRKCDLVILATLWRDINEQVSRTLSSMRKGALFVSVIGLMEKSIFIVGQARKEHDICEGLQRKSVDIAFVHCMCASSMPLAGQNVAVYFLHCSAPHRKWLANLLHKNDAKMVVRTPDHHDTVMAFLQKQLRIFAASFSVAAIKEGITFEDMFALSQPPGRTWLKVVARVIRQSEVLNEHIMLDQKALPAIVDAILEFSQIHMLRHRNRDGDLEAATFRFRAVFGKAREFVKGDLARQLAASLT